MSDHPHDDPHTGDPDELLDIPIEQVRARVEEGMITPEGDGKRFRRVELIHARNQGG